MTAFQEPLIKSVILFQPSLPRILKDSHKFLQRVLMISHCDMKKVLIWPQRNRNAALMACQNATPTILSDSHRFFHITTNVSHCCLKKVEIIRQAALTTIVIPSQAALRLCPKMDHKRIHGKS